MGFGIVSNGCVDKIFDCKFLFVPCLFGATNEVTQKFLDYVRNGGNLYFSGAGNETLLRELAGLRCTGKLTRETRTYIAPAPECEKLFGGWFNADFPLPVEHALPVVEFIGEGNACATITLPYTAQDELRFASIHSNPPGIPTQHPALVIKKFGKGNVVWSAAPLELDTRPHYKNTVMNLMEKFLAKENFSVIANTTKNIEVVSFKTNDGFLVSAVDLTCDDELLPVRPFGISVKSDRSVKSVVKLPDMTPVAFENKDGRVVFNTGGFTMFGMWKLIR